MPSEDTDPLSLEGVPDIARPVIITTEEDATGDGEGNRGDTAQDVVVREGVKLAVGTDIEKPARCIIGTSGKGIAVREEAVGTSITNQQWSEIDH